MYDMLMVEDLRFALKFASTIGIVPAYDYASRYLRDEIKHLDTVKRDVEIRRKLQKAKAKRHVQWFDAEGNPTREHWALIALAYSPVPKAFARWVDRTLETQYNSGRDVGALGKAAV